MKKKPGLHTKNADNLDRSDSATTLRVVNDIPLDELTFFGLVEPPGLGLSLSDEQPALGEF